MRLIDAEGIRVKPEFMHNVCGMAMIRVEDIVRILNEQPTIEPEPHWIPCGERLPEEDGLYLVTTSKGQVQVHVFNHNGNSEEYWMRCNKAWMPLPPSYKGVDDVLDQ